jgi:hypothetical protein
MNLARIACMGALTLLALGCDKVPEHDGSHHPWWSFHRGHKPPGAERAGENFSVAVAPGQYPPRALGLAAQRRPPSDSWLLDADSDYDRFRRLEIVLGADQSMREIGARFLTLHRALQAGELALAHWEWEKATRAAEIALLKRPANEEKVERMLLDGPWARLGVALAHGDATEARGDFEATRQACLQCHAERKLGFLNQLPALVDTAPQEAAGTGS